MTRRNRIALALHKRTAERVYHRVTRSRWLYAVHAAMAAMSPDKLARVRMWADLRGAP